MAQKFRAVRGKRLAGSNNHLCEMCNAFPSLDLNANGKTGGQFVKRSFSLRRSIERKIRIESNYLIGRKNGFTLTELIVILLIIGILAVTAIPRLLNTRTFSTRGFYDQAIQMIRYGQKVAIAQGRNVYVNIDAAGGKMCLTYSPDVNCSSPSGVFNPSERNSKYSLTAPSDVTFSTSLSFAFTALGSPSPNMAVSLGITGDATTRTITVEQETGYVH